jgi:DNA-binding response OmpR family regulator
MLTNLGEKEKIQEALEMGADDYLVKASLTPSELVEIIKDKLDVKTKI